MSVIFPPYSGGGSGGGAVDSVNGQTGSVTITPDNIGAVSDTELAITTTANRLYGTDSSGNPSVYIVAQHDATGSVARRGTFGVLTVGTPTADSHAATKAYVDDLFASAIQGDGSVTHLVAVTEAEYAALTPDATTHYDVTP